MNPKVEPITVAEACSMLGLSAQMVRWYLALGKITGTKAPTAMNGTPVWQIDRASVEAFKPRKAGRPKAGESVSPAHSSKRRGMTP